MTSPYRSAGQARSRKRDLAFYHARMLLLGVIASLVVAWGLGCVMTPRDVTIDCIPSGSPALECRSVVRAIWGDSRPFTSRVAPDAASVPFFPLAGILNKEQPRPELDIDIEYTTRQRESWSRIVAKYGYGRPVPLTEMWPTHFGGTLITDLSAFAAALRSGNRATLRYRTGWHGLFSGIVMPLVALGLLWTSSGRTRVVFDPDAAEVAIETRNYWLSGVERRRIPHVDIAGVVVAAEPGARGGTMYRPAFRLRSGEIMALGRTGLTEPARAEHWATQLRKLLDLPEAPST